MEVICFDPNNIFLSGFFMYFPFPEKASVQKSFSDSSCFQNNLSEK